MEKKLADNQNKIRIIFGIILFIYAAFCRPRGIDVSDITYSLGNYQYMDSLDSMWIIATFISNIFGRLIISLPGAGTLYGATVYATCLFAVFIESIYIILSKHITPWIVFVSELIAVSLAWCPKVIFYNYLTYALMAFAVIILAYALKSGRYALFVAAGVILGFNVFVRFSNAIECLLIIGVWFYEISEHHKPSDFIKKTLACIGGYIVGFIIPLLFVVIKYGINAYFDMIDSLFAMTQTAEDYGSYGVFRAMRYQILDTFKDMKYLILVVILFVAAEIILHKVVTKISQNDKEIKVDKGNKIYGILETMLRIFNVLALILLCLYFFKKGIYTTNYYEYGSIFKCANTFIILAFILNLLNVFGLFKSSGIFRAVSLMCLVQMLIAPMGTNNHMYAIMNNMFITAPVTSAIIYTIYTKLRDKKYGFPIYSACVYIVAILLVQSMIFHINFAYVDGTEGTRLDTAVNNIDRLGCLLTSKDKAQGLDDLYDYIESNDLLDNKALLFGQDAVGLAYIMDLDPAINTLWPDLDSYTVTKFENALSEISADAIIITSEKLTYGANVETKKQMLEDYMADNDYEAVFENDMYTLYYRKAQ